MNEEMRKRRRQAAWFCFEPYLAEDKLIRAIELLEERFQLEGTNTLISYVTTVCNQFEIHKDVAKALCVKFFELVAYDRTILPKDPLPMLDEKRFSRSLVTQPAEIVAEKKVEQPTEEKSEEVETEKLDNKTNSAIENTPPHCVIFICFVKQIIKEVFSDNSRLVHLLTKLSDHDLKIDKRLKAAIELWSQNTQNFRWVLTTEEEILSQLTHLIYLSLCEAVGPVEADQVFHKAVAFCEQRPEAKLFSPTQLL